MRRFLVTAVLVALAAVMAPAMGDTELQSCSASQAATASPLIGDTAPTCTFEVTCTAITLGCVYVWTLDVNGTGLVEGTMTAEVVGPEGTAQWFHPDGSEADSPTCSGTLQCHTSFSTENPVLLGVFGQIGTGTTLRVTCTAGGLALFENVGCGISAVEFGPL